MTVLEWSQIKVPETDLQPLRNVIDLEESDLEETDIPEILGSAPEAFPLMEIAPGYTAVEYIVYATSYQVPAFYFTVSDSS